MGDDSSQASLEISTTCSIFVPSASVNKYKDHDQWKNVFLDQGYIPEESLTPDYFQWLYTAFTRASGTLYLVNYPKEQID